MLRKKILLLAVGAVLLFPFESDAALFQRFKDRRAEREQATTVQAPTQTNSECRYVNGVCVTHGGSGVVQLPPGTTGGDPELDAYMATLGYVNPSAVLQAAPEVPEETQVVVEIAGSVALENANVLAKAEALMVAEAELKTAVEAEKQAIALQVVEYEKLITNMQNQVLDLIARGETLKGEGEEE